MVVYVCAKPNTLNEDDFMKKLIVSITLTILLTVALITSLTLLTFGKTIKVGQQGYDYASLTSPILAATIKDGDTIEIHGTMSATSLPASGAKSITITGDTLDLTEMGATIALNGNVTFENITINVADSATIYANGYKVVIGEGVTFNKTLSAIYGGGASGTTVESTDLTVLSGNFLRIYGGSENGTVSSDTNLIVGGTTNKACTWTSHSGTYKIFGGGLNDAIGGSTHLTFTGDARANYIYGGSTGGTSTIGGSKYATMSGGHTMSFYGGNHDVNAGTNTYTTMTGGELQQLFGGNEDATMTGNVDLRVMGGTISRRIYGGCYNEWKILWKSNYYVNGNITLIIGGKANITLDYDDNDIAIYAASRRKPVKDTGNRTIIFADATAAAAYGGKLGAQDSLMQGIMTNTTSYTSLHKHTYTASGAVITQNCDQGCAAATATLSLTESGPFTYNGKAHTPAYNIAYSGNWLGYEPTVTYANNTNAGTATVTAATIDGVNASLSFTVNKMTPDAPVLTANKETVRGKADGTVTGLTTDMEWSTDGTTFTPVTDTNMTFAAGTYYVRYAESSNCAQSASTAVTVEAGDPLTVTCKIDGVVKETLEVSYNETLDKASLPAIPAKEGYTQIAPYWDVTDSQLTNITASLIVEAIYTQNQYTVTLPAVQTGYTLTANGEAVLHGDSCTVTFALAAGYSKTGGFAVKANGSPITLNASGQYTFTATENVTFTVEGVADITPPAVNAEIGTDTFSGQQPAGADRYYASGTKVTVTATDAGTAVQKIEYLFFVTVPTEDELNSAVWTAYTEAFALPSDALKHLYVKVTDNAGNVTIVATPRLGIDQAAPTVNGFVNGGAVYGDLSFTVTDETAVTVKVDGQIIEKVGDSYTVAADNTEHTVTVTDAVGNVTTYTVTVYRNYTVTFKDGTAVYATRTVGYGQDLTDIPTLPTRTGHTSAWSSTNFTNVTSDMTVSVVYTPFTYTVTLPQSTVGYTVIGSGNTTYGSEYTITLSLSEGYSKDVGFAVKLNGSAVTLVSNSYTFTVNGDTVITVEGVADITPPAIHVNVGNTYTSSALWPRDENKYFNADAAVHFVLSDKGSGVKERLYYFSSDLLTEEALEHVEWLTYTEALALAPNHGKILYAKVTDHAGNASLASTARLNVDDTAPVIGGFNNGDIIYGELSFNVTDDRDLTVWIDNIIAEKTDERYIIAADNNEHTVKAVDAVGNETVYTVTVYRIYTVTFVHNNAVFATRSVGHGQDLTDLPDLPTVSNYNVQWDTSSLTCVQEDVTVTLIRTPVNCTVTLPPAPVGYTLTSGSGTTVPYDSIFSFTIVISPGYSKTAAFDVKVNGASVTPYNGNTYRIPVRESITITVVGIADITPPAINGFTNNATVYGDLSFTVSDVLAVSVTVDGNAAAKVGNSYTVTADNATHTVVATDAAGNTVSYKVTVYRVYTVTFTASGQQIAQVTVNHGQALTEIPAIPQKEGYTVTAPVWDVTTFDAVTSDMTVTAVYTADPVAENPPASGEGTDEGTGNGNGNTPSGESSTGKTDQLGASENANSTDTQNSGSSSAIVIVVVVAGGSAAVGGSVLGVLLHKKKKR